MKEQPSLHHMTAHVIPYGFDDATVIAPSNEQVAWIHQHTMFSAAQFNWKDLSESEYLWETRLHGRAPVKIVLNSRVGGRGLNSPGSGLPPVVGFCKHEMNIDSKEGEKFTD